MGALELFRGQDQAVGAMEVQCFSQVLEGASFSSLNLVLFGFPMGSSRVPPFWVLVVSTVQVATSACCLRSGLKVVTHTHTHTHTAGWRFQVFSRLMVQHLGNLLSSAVPDALPLPVLTSRYPEAMDKCCHTWESGYRQPSRWLIFIVLKEIAR